MENPLVLCNRFPNDKLTLEKLAEEAAEVIQAKSKIIHFGLLDTYNNTKNHPDQTNQEKLETELGHLFAVVDILVARGIVRYDRIYGVKEEKWDKMEHWNKHKGSITKKGELF